MTNPTIIHAEGARELLSSLPALIGYVPQRSLVLVPMASGRSLGAMRVDLGAEPAALADTALGLICRVPGAVGVVAVIYTDDDADSTRALTEQITRFADRDGLHLVDVLYVASNGYGSHHADSTPRPVSEIVTPDPLRERVAASMTSEATIPAADPERAAEIAMALDAMNDDGLIDFVTVAEDALSGDPADLEARRAAILLVGIGTPMYRDVALIQWATSLSNGDDALAAQVGHYRGIAIPEHIAHTLWGVGARPDANRLIAGLAIVRHLTAYADEADRPNLLSAAAWLSWALGRSTHAEVFTDLAFALDADHSMSQIVATMTKVGKLPDWAFSR